MREFPITEVMDEQACYDFLLGVLHPQGLHCPAGHQVARGPAPHLSDRAPLVDYRCRTWGKVFKLCTGTVWRGTQYSCRPGVLLVRGFAQGVPTLPLAKEVKVEYETGLTRRHSWQEQALKKKRAAGGLSLKRQRTRGFTRRAQKARPSGTRRSRPAAAPIIAKAWARGQPTVPRFQAWWAELQGSFA